MMPFEVFMYNYREVANALPSVLVSWNDIHNDLKQIYISHLTELLADRAAAIRENAKNAEHLQDISRLDMKIIPFSRELMTCMGIVFP